MVEVREWLATTDAVDCSVVLPMCSGSGRHRSMHEHVVNLADVGIGAVVAVAQSLRDGTSVEYLGCWL